MTVVYLSHYREKLKFVKEQLARTELDIDGLCSNLLGSKKQLSKLKKERDKLEKALLKEKQDTAIVS